VYNVTSGGTLLPYKMPFTAGGSVGGRTTVDICMKHLLFNRKYNRLRV
jgi:hypothetical protein